MRSHCGVSSTNSQPYLSNTHTCVAAVWSLLLLVYYSTITSTPPFFWHRGVSAKCHMRGSVVRKPHPSYRPSLVLYFFLHRQGRAKRRIRGSKTSSKLSPHSPSHELPSCAPQVSIKSSKFAGCTSIPFKRHLLFPHSLAREFCSYAHLMLHKDSLPTS
jgi:hypothetical protein